MSNPNCTRPAFSIELCEESSLALHSPWSLWNRILMKFWLDHFLQNKILNHICRHETLHSQWYHFHHHPRQKSSSESLPDSVSMQPLKSYQPHRGHDEMNYQPKQYTMYQGNPWKSPYSCIDPGLTKRTPALSRVTTMTLVGDFKPLQAF